MSEPWRDIDSSYYCISIISQRIYIFFICIIYVEREIVRLLFVAKHRDFIARFAYTSVLTKISPLRDPRSEAGAYAKSRASVSERKHIKDGALLKEERKEKNRGARVNRSFFRGVPCTLCVCTLSSELCAFCQTERGAFSPRTSLFVVPKVWSIRARIGRMFRSVCNTTRQNRNFVNFMRGVRVSNSRGYISLLLYFKSDAMLVQSCVSRECSVLFERDEGSPFPNRSFLCLARAATTYSRYSHITSQIF